MSKTLIQPKPFSKGPHQPCPTGWPGHDTLAGAWGDAHHRNADPTARGFRGGRWHAAKCDFCHKAHTLPITRRALRLKNPKQRAAFDRETAARRAKASKVAA